MYKYLWTLKNRHIKGRHSKSYIHDGKTNLNFGKISSKVEELWVSKNYFKPAEKNESLI
jgi:hypothetical protein